jgi:hypothetical protein
MKPQALFSICAALALTLACSNAAIVVVAEFHLGEAGSLGANNVPLDSASGGSPSGSQNISNEISGAAGTVGTSGVYAPGSTAYLDTSGAGNEGWYDGSSTLGSLATDNFGFGIFVRAASLGATQGDVFTLGGGQDSFKLSLSGNGWAASSHNRAWIGTDNGISGSFTANQWVHLALVRTSGTTTFYINGTTQATYGGNPVHNAMHLSVAPGGSSYFDGHMDEARVVTFDAADVGAGNINVLNALQGIPESSTTLLGAVSVILLLRRRR